MACTPNIAGIHPGMDLKASRVALAYYFREWIKVKRLLSEFFRSRFKRRLVKGIAPPAHLHKERVKVMRFRRLDNICDGSGAGDAVANDPEPPHLLRRGQGGGLRHNASRETQQREYHQ